MDSDDFPELSLAGKMVWHITRGCTVAGASHGCRISPERGQEIMARPFTERALRAARKAQKEQPQ